MTNNRTATMIAPANGHTVTITEHEGANGLFQYKIKCECGERKSAITLHAARRIASTYIAHNID